MRNVFLASTAIFLATSGPASAREVAPSLPSAKEIQAISIEYDHPREDTVAFQAKPEDWSAIRATLTPAKRDPNPAKWEALGTVRLLTKNGQPLNVDLYTPNKPSAGMSAGHHAQLQNPSYGGNTKKLIRALNKAYQESQTSE